MRRLIIHLSVALLTFVIGTAASLLLAGVFNTTNKSAQKKIVTVETRTVTKYKSEESLPTCGCGQNLSNESVTTLKTADLKAPIRGGVLNGRALSLPQPSYPAIARAAHASGSVVVEVLIDEAGCVQSARAMGGHPLLQQSSVQAARRACFSPTRLSGQPVKVTGTIAYNYVIP